MNNTIEILAEGENHIPAGTVVTLIKNGIVRDAYKTIADGIICFTQTTEYIFQVDFKDVAPLYPHKGMKVPAEGIEFTDGDSRVVDAGENGFTWISTCESYFHEWGTTIRESFELKRTLPKTLTVCKDCYKELCECMREPGLYRVKCGVIWIARHWDGSYFADGEHGLHTIAECVYKEIDWKHPINVIPESER